MRFFMCCATSPSTAARPAATSKGVAACTAYLQTKPKGFGSAKYGWSPDTLCTAGHAKVFGVPLALGFKTASKALSFGADPSTVRIVTVIAIIVMASTTFLTQRQLIARNAASGTAMPSQQRIMLYVLPPMFALFGLNFQMGVLIYWVTTNVWSLGQQHFVIKAMPHIAPGGAPPPAAATKGSSPPGDSRAIRRAAAGRSAARRRPRRRRRRWSSGGSRPPVRRAVSATGTRPQRPGSPR